MECLQIALIAPCMALFLRFAVQAHRGWSMALWSLYGLVSMGILWQYPAPSGLMVWPALMALAALCASGHALQQRWLFALASIGCSVLLASCLSKGYTAEHFAWLPTWHIYGSFAIEPLALPLMILTLFVGLLAFILTGEHHKVPLYGASLSALLACVMAVFMAQDAMVFYAFFEMSLLPMFLLIGCFGSENRFFASLYFFVFTFAGSLLLLLAWISLGHMHQSFSWSFWVAHAPQDLPLWISAATLLAFALKVPVLGLHSWLPFAHAEAPTAGSMMLAAILLKLGGYALFKWWLPLFPSVYTFYAPGMVVLSVLAIVFISAVAWVQDDAKRMIAYASIAHMGFVTLGLFAPGLTSLSAEAILGLYQGAYFQMISHGLISAGLFAVFGLIYQQTHTRRLSDYGGLAEKMPWTAFWMMFFILANAGMPATSAFVAEFQVLWGLWLASPFWTALSMTHLVLSAAYSLHLYRKIFHGPSHMLCQKAEEASWQSQGVLAMLALAILFLGCFPQTLWGWLEMSLRIFIEQR